MWQKKKDLKTFESSGYFELTVFELNVADLYM